MARHEAFTQQDQHQDGREDASVDIAQVQGLRAGRCVVCGGLGDELEVELEFPRNRLTVLSAPHSCSLFRKSQLSRQSQ